MRHIGSLAVLGAAVFVVAVGCDSGALQPATADSYPLPSGQANVHEFVPADLGESARAIVLNVRIRPGDRIELLSADPVGKVNGADVAFFLSRNPDPSGTMLDPLEPLVGAVLTNDGMDADQTVGIVAEVTPRVQGRFELNDVRLSYRVNDGAAQEGDAISATLAVCGGTSLCASP